MGSVSGIHNPLIQLAISNFEQESSNLYQRQEQALENAGQEIQDDQNQSS
jgi:hypothetical protein